MQYRSSIKKTGGFTTKYIRPQELSQRPQKNLIGDIGSKTKCCARIEPESSEERAERLDVLTRNAAERKESESPGEQIWKTQSPIAKYSCHNHNRNNRRKRKLVDCQKTLFRENMYKSERKGSRL